MQKSPDEMAELIERFLSGKLKYRSEWYDFMDVSQPDPKLDEFRKKCAFFSDQLINHEKSLDLSRDERWEDAKIQLRKIAAQLRELESSRQGS